MTFQGIWTSIAKKHYIAGAFALVPFMCGVRVKSLFGFIFLLVFSSVAEERDNCFCFRHKIGIHLYSKILPSFD